MSKMSAHDLRSLTLHVKYSTACSLFYFSLSLRHFTRQTHRNMSTPCDASEPRHRAPLTPMRESTTANRTAVIECETLRFQAHWVGPHLPTDQGMQYVAHRNQLSSSDGAQRWSLRNRAVHHANNLCIDHVPDTRRSSRPRRQDIRHLLRYTIC